MTINSINDVIDLSHFMLKYFVLFLLARAVIPLQLSSTWAHERACHAAAAIFETGVSTLDFVRVELVIVFQWHLWARF